MQPTIPQASQSAPARSSRRRRVLLALVVAAILVAAGITVYILTRPAPIPLNVTDGSIDRTLTSTFEDYGSNNPVSRVYTATTTAETTEGTTSTLTLRLFLGAFMDGSIIHTDLFPVVSGAFAPTLAPATLTLTFNQTGRGAWAYGYAYPTAFNNSFAWAPIAFPGPANVTDTRANLPQLGGNGSTSMSTGLANTTTSGSRYEFLYPAFIEEDAPVHADVVFGIRATVTGPFAPAVSVGIVVHFVDLAIPNMGFQASIGKTPDGSRWTLSIRDPGGTYANTSLDLRIATLDHITVVQSTPLGDLYRSPYNTSLAYIPATANTSTVEAGDVITLSVALYSYDYYVQIVAVSGSIMTTLYAATLG